MRSGIRICMRADVGRRMNAHQWAAEVAAYVQGQRVEIANPRENNWGPLQQGRGLATFDLPGYAFRIAQLERIQS